MNSRILLSFFIFVFGNILVLAQETEEIISVASYLESNELNASPVDVISAEEFKNLRVSTVAELSKYLSIASGSNFQTNALDGVDQGMANITLRGMDHASTLVLINKKRQTHSGTPSDEGEGYIDINIIPEIALYRIEILKDGASSLYGSDAVAGVINFQTYQQFDGMRLSLGSQKTSNYDQRDNSLGALFGGDVFGGSYVFAFSSLNKSPLNASSIPKFAELGLSGLGNSFKVTQADSVASGLYAGSYNKNQTVPDPNCVENGGVLAGPRCKFLYGERFNIVNDEDHTKGYLHFTRPSARIDYSATLLMAKIDVNDNPQSPSYPALSYLSKKILPGQGGSPFNVPVIWYGRPLGSAFPSPNSPKAISQYHLSNRLVFDISQNLDFELSLTASEHKNKHNRPDTIESRFEAAILGQGGPDGNEQWNIFLPLENSATLIDYIKGSETSTKIGSLISLDGILRGQKNGVNFALGFQFNSEDLQIDYSEMSSVAFDANGKLTKGADLLFLGGGTNVSTSRNKQAVFFEANKNYGNALDLILSGRYERLDNESSFDPKLSFKYALVDSLSLRLSRSTAFSSPSMAQMFSSEINLGSVRDVNDSVFVRQASIGNPNLKSATSSNTNFGLIYEKGVLKLTIDYWEIDYKNRIEVESAQAILSSDPNGPSVTRNEFGDLIGVTTSYFNEENTLIRGADFNINYFLDIKDNGYLTFSLKGTKLNKFLTPGLTENQQSKMINRVGRFNFNSHTHSLPKNRINSFINWNYKDYVFGLTSRYIDGYINERPITGLGITYGYENKIDSFLVHDLSLRKILKVSSGELKLSLALINILDESAPRLYDAPDFSFDTRVHDPRGRMLGINIEYKF